MHLMSHTTNNPMSHTTEKIPHITFRASFPLYFLTNFLNDSLVVSYILLETKPHALCHSFLPWFSIVKVVVSFSIFAPDLFHIQDIQKCKEITSRCRLYDQHNSLSLLLLHTVGNGHSGIPHRCCSHAPRGISVRLMNLPKENMGLASLINLPSSSSRVHEIL
jgi:hypothetical protein